MKYIRFLFHLLWASALCGIGLSYKSVYLFHIVLIFNIIGWVWYALNGHLGSKKEVEMSREKMKKTDFSHDFLLYFWLAVPLWFALEILYCESKTAALQHLVILSFGVSLIILSVLNLKTVRDFKQIFNITAVIGGINIGIGLVETTGIWRYPIGNLSRCNSFFGYPTEFWNGLLAAFHGALGSVAPSLNYHVTLVGAFERMSTIPTGMHWNPNDYALFLLLLFPFFLFTKNKIAHTIGVCSIFFLVVMAGARLVFIALIAILVVSLAVSLASVAKALSFSKASTRTAMATAIAWFVVLFIATNGFGISGKYFWQCNEMAFFYKRAHNIESAQHIATSSADVRKNLIIAGVSTLKIHAGIGIGGGNMAILLQREGGIGSSRINKLHNFWLELAVEGGFLFALAFVLWFLFLLKKLYYIIQKNTEESPHESPLYYHALSTFMALIGLVIGGIAPSSLLYYLPMYALFGWAVALTRMNEPELKKVVQQKISV